MSKLDKMIMELCPEGVEYVKLGDIAEIGTGSGNRQDSEDNGIYPFFVRSKEVLRSNAYEFDEEAILIPGEGGVGDIFHYYKGKYALHQRTYRIHITQEELNAKFLYYFLFANFKSYIMRKAVASTATSIRKPMIEDFSIPLPPLSIQQKIVSVLDSFTTLIDKMKQEVEKRKKQMEYYREKLLTFEDGECEWKYVSDVAENFTGLTYKPDNVNDTGTIVLRSSNIKNNMLSFDDNVYVQNINIPQRAIVKEGDILICVRNGSRALIGKCAMIPKCKESMAFGAFMTVLRANNMNSKYLFYAWQLNQSVLQYKGDDAMPINQITSKDFKHISIPVPPLEKQAEIVSTLDKFESYITKLEKMIVLRQKQYEYYREQLLTFRPSPSLP